ncbi:DODA-type extradiol aromatic ring-opening family dioxygenase [Effusibacillus dendaii]|uniref:3,4-dihydroxyphenylacetate 2,3-dioxygenase n=1 Tax=Effusibacillus dendaii TaxID=2743772 RepID=A0A7I8DE45_9BACL|nr:extradiol ring-cleavage dioxygenase [Effusibacillus dendaii]BCJ88384.1 3,4-dihydroxyphenylacetate 2,3-dioxygenase [Effusibacillus dendaii]
MTIELGVLTAHVPRICDKDKVPDFQKEMVESMNQVAQTISNLKPDVIVLVSTHWTGTFHHFVDATPLHKGILTAVECPELISDVHYFYPGDHQLGSQLAEAGKELGIPVVAINDPTYIWDYGTLVPLRYLVPNEDIPVVELSINWSASLDETYEWGKAIGRVMRNSEKRCVFVSSGALAHNLVRGPEKMPTLSERALENQFIEYMVKGEAISAREMLPQFARAAGVESGGRHLAMLLGVLEPGFRGQFLGYGPSSGSGNAIMTFSLNQAAEKVS